MAPLASITRPKFLSELLLIFLCAIVSKNIWKLLCLKPHQPHLADALSRELNGTLQLEACTNRVSALGLRLRVKYDNCRWWRSRQDSDPWDSGYFLANTVAQAHLAMFAPRRATLIVADELPPQSLIVAIEALNARSSDFRHPVRLLIINAVLPDSLGLRWDANRTVWTSAERELGEVPVIDMSKVYFGPAQFRRVMDAQVEANGERLQLPGSDSEGGSVR